jgi:hypothetical protein
MQLADAARMLSRHAAARPLTTALFAAVAFAAAGCQMSLPYAPRPSPRVQIVERRLAKNGQLHDFSHLGALVQGNPAAEAEARAYASATNVATVLDAVGVLTDLGGLGVVVGGAAARDRAAVTFGVTLALFGVDFMLFANSASSRAHDHVTNAVNIYNDGLPPEMFAPRAPWSVPALPSTTGTALPPAYAPAPGPWPTPAPAPAPVPSPAPPPAPAP